MVLRLKHALGGLFGVVACLLVLNYMRFDGVTAVERGKKTSTPIRDATADGDSPTVTEAAARTLPWQRLCPSGPGSVQLIFPHVNKAGGRSLEATFLNGVDTRHRFVSQGVRSRWGREMRASRLTAQDKAHHASGRAQALRAARPAGALQAFFSWTPGGRAAVRDVSGRPARGP